MALEKVQRKAIDYWHGLGLKAQTYEERLKELELQTLEERRHQAYMHMVHKIIHTSKGLQSETWFEMAGDSARPTRANADALNVKVMHGRLEIRRFFFSVRVTKQWNTVPSHMKQMIHAW